MSKTRCPSSKFVYANGIRHHYLEWGALDQPAVILLHGIGLCAHVWKWAGRELSQDYHVMAFDLRGHGDSEKPGKDYTFESLGRDLAELAPALGLTSPFVVGHSAGGSAAIIANRLFPGVLGPTVVVDSRVGGTRALSSRPDMRDRPARTRRKRSIWENRAAMAAAYRDRGVFKTWDESIFLDYIEGGTRLLPDGRAELKCPTEVEATFYEERAALNTSPYVRGLKGNYLLLLGNYPGAQTLDDPGILEFLQEVEGSQAKVAPQGSHFLPLEHPEIVLEIVRKYFAKFR